MAAPLSNFIPINRKLFKHELWLEKRAYSRFEAWLDLVAAARFDNSEGRVVIGSTVVRYERGELVASIRFLAERWGWKQTKANTYINLLLKEGMIKRRTAGGTIQTIVTICNYNAYNPVSKKEEQRTEQGENNPRTAEEQAENKLNKENNDQKSKPREIYRAFAHLILFTDEYLKLAAIGYSQKQIDKILDEVENYKNNKKYTSLFLTAKKWLEKEDQVAAAASPTGGRIVKIASAFEQALQYG